MLKERGITVNKAGSESVAREVDDRAHSRQPPTVAVHASTLCIAATDGGAS